MPELDDGVFLIDGESAGSTPWEWDSLTEEGTMTLALDPNADSGNDGSGTNGYTMTGDGTNNIACGVYSFADQADFYCITG